MGERNRARAIRSPAEQPRVPSLVEEHRLLRVALACAAAAGTILLAGLMVHGDATTIDAGILRVFRNPADLADPLGSRNIENFVRDVTALGSFGVLAFLVFAVSGVMALKHRRDLAATLLAISASGWAVSTLVKLGFDRARPDVVPQAVYVGDPSLPSGHSMMAAIVYFTLAVAIGRLDADPRVRTYVFWIAIVLTAAVALSRLYLGVHWPTDVLVGIALGACWTALGWSIYDRRRSL